MAQEKLGVSVLECIVSINVIYIFLVKMDKLGRYWFDVRSIQSLMTVDFQVNCEVIDLVSILPWDRETVLNSVQKTGRCIISHEAPYTGGFGAEIAASIQVKLYSFVLDL